MLLRVHVIITLHPQWTTTIPQIAVRRQVHKELDPSVEQSLAQGHAVQVFIIKLLLASMHVKHMTLQIQQAQIIQHATQRDIARQTSTQTDHEQPVMHKELTIFNNKGYN